MVVNVQVVALSSHERLKNETPVMVQLVANGAIAKCRVVLAIPLVESASWLLGVEFEQSGKFPGS